MRTISKGFGFLILLSVSFLFGFGWRDIQRGEAPSVRSLASLVGIKRATPGLAPEKVFRENYNRILTSYAKSVDPKKLKYAGMSGMLASLGDPHTIFLEPRMAQAFNDETTGNFFGVGATLMPDPLGARVQTAFEDGPAYKAGMRDSDLISAVDGKAIAGTPLEDVVTRIKGKEGTVVKLTIVRAKQPKPLELVIRRARIIAPTVRGKVLPGKIGYLVIQSFSEPTPSQFDRELDKVEKQGIDGLVIDLRGNPGGLLESAVDMLSRFVENKTVVTMRFRDGHKEVASTYGGSLRDFNYPVTILIDGYSASAAEIFSGVLHDYRKATLVGEHSYGKASVQNVYPLVDKASAKITIAKYMLPSTPDISRKVDADGIYVSGGLKPDVPVSLDLEKDVKYGDPATDNVLAAAIDVIRQKRS